MRRIRISPRHPNTQIVDDDYPRADAALMDWVLDALRCTFELHRSAGPPPEQMQ